LADEKTIGAMSECKCCLNSKRELKPRNLIQSNELNAEKTKENKLIEVIPSRYRKTKQVKTDPTKRQVEIENRYMVLENLQEPTEIVDALELGKIIGVTNILRRTLKKKDHKVILIGESHARECAEKISNFLGNSYEVTGYFNPSTGLEVITNSAKKEIDHMTQDVMIVCGSVNNVSKNELIKGLEYITQFVQNRRNTNVIIMNAPHRLNLEESSCVNEQIKVFNRK
jgi:hypothetical protein